MPILVRTKNTFYSIVSIKFIGFLSVAEQHRLTVNAASGIHFCFVFQMTYAKQYVRLRAII